jgi:hypothetical protein
MSGKKPSNVGFAIVRGFRGQMLYLASVHTGNGFHWVTGKAGAMVIADADAAVALSERASREYGAKTTVVDFSAAEHVIETYRVPGFESPSARLLQAGVRKMRVRNPEALVVVAFDGCTINHQHSPDCKQPS